MNTEDDYVIIWEAPKIETPEFRLYYDDNGKVIGYCGDKSMTGNYVVIDKQTFLEGRMDLRIIDGEISTATPNAVVYKLMPSTEGTRCYKNDVSIIIEDDTIETIKWKIITYEL